MFIYLFSVAQAFLVILQNFQLLGALPGKPLLIQPYAGEDFELIEGSNSWPGC